MRPVTTENIFELLDGCFTSATLGTALELGLFWLLDEKPLTTAEISQSLTIPLNRCNILLQRLCWLGLLEDTAEGYTISALARETILGSGSKYMIVRNSQVVLDNKPACYQMLHICGFRKR